jgi:phage repressor protein C with HTH and peptisase S24 domain
VAQGLIAGLEERLVRLLDLAALGTDEEVLNRLASRLAIPLLQEIEKRAPRLTPDRFSFIPKANANLSASGGLVSEEGAENQYAFRRDWLSTIGSSVDNLIMIEVSGDSMLPTLQNLDVVLVDTGRTGIRDKRIYAFGERDQCFVKRLILIPDKRMIRVFSDNDDYFPYDRREDEIRVFGEVIWSARAYLKPNQDTP